MISINRCVKRGFLAFVLVLIVTTNAFAYKALLNLGESNNWVLHAHAVLAATNEFVVALGEAKSGLLAYVMTGEERNLGPNLEAF